MEFIGRQEKRNRGNKTNNKMEDTNSNISIITLRVNGVNT